MSIEAMPDDFPELSEAELDEYLRSLGLDPVELVQRMRVRIQKIIDESPLNPKNQAELVIVKLYCGNLGSSRNPIHHIGGTGNYHGQRARVVSVIAKAVHESNGFDNFWYFWAELLNEESTLPDNHAANSDCTHL